MAVYCRRLRHASTHCTGIPRSSVQRAVPLLLLKHNWIHGSGCGVPGLQKHATRSSPLSFAKLQHFTIAFAIHLHESEEMNSQLGGNSIAKSIGGRRLHTLHPKNPLETGAIDVLRGLHMALAGRGRLEASFAVFRDLGGFQGIQSRRGLGQFIVGCKPHEPSNIERVANPTPPAPPPQTPCLCREEAELARRRGLEQRGASDSASGFRVWGFRLSFSAAWEGLRPVGACVCSSRRSSIGITGSS